MKDELNIYMKAKVEACVELSSGPLEFRHNVQRVTGLTHSGFLGSPFLRQIQNDMEDGLTDREIVQLYFGV